MIKAIPFSRGETITINLVGKIRNWRKDLLRPTSSNRPHESKSHRCSSEDKRSPAIPKKRRPEIPKKENSHILLRKKKEQAQQQWCPMCYSCDRKEGCEDRDSNCVVRCLEEKSWRLQEDLFGCYWLSKTKLRSFSPAVKLQTLSRSHRDIEASSTEWADPALAQKGRISFKLLFVCVFYQISFNFCFIGCWIGEMVMVQLHHHHHHLVVISFNFNFLIIFPDYCQSRLFNIFSFLQPTSSHGDSGKWKYQIPNFSKSNAWRVSMSLCFSRHQKECTCRTASTNLATSQLNWSLFGTIVNICCKEAIFSLDPKMGRLARNGLVVAEKCPNNAMQCPPDLELGCWSPNWGAGQKSSPQAQSSQTL